MKTRRSGSSSSSSSLNRFASLANVSPDWLSNVIEEHKKRKEEKKVFRPSDLVHRKNWRELQFKDLGQRSDARGPSETTPISEARKRRKQEKKVYRPSDLVDPKNWRELQFKDLGQCSDAPRFICYRGPPETTPRVPLVLLHKSFMEFCSNAQGFSELEKVDMKAAFKLWEICSVGWDDEVPSDMTLLFTTYLQRPVLSLGSMDGVIENTMVVFEYKTEPHDGWFRGLDYLRRRFLAWKGLHTVPSHGLLVLIACPYIQVVAAVMDWGKEKLLAEPLTPYVNCFGPVHNVHRVAGLLRALKIFSSNYVPEPTIDCNMPFVFKDKVTQQLRGNLVYLLGKDRVAKFTRHYGEEAHRSWEEQGVAPPLLGVTSIGNGWLQVEMSFLGIEDGWLDAEEVVSKCKEHPSSLENLINSIRAAAQKGHSTGYVHGDLRLPNVKVREVDGLFHIMFVDFGWAGRIGEATYPSLLNPELGWHPEAQFGKKIAVAHDLHFADKLVEQLENLYTSSGAKF